MTFERVEIGPHVLYRGDCLEVLPTLAAERVDAIVTDPPYGLHFMGKTWDKFGGPVGKRILDTSGTRPNFDAGTYDPRRADEFQVFLASVFVECLRVLKPGGHLLTFGSPRRHHRAMCALEDAGFELRDTLCWLFGQGFPKSLNLHGEDEGWGTALKPGWEPIILARKPLEGTVAANVATHGTGALHIDACRISVEGGSPAPDRRYTARRTGHAPVAAHQRPGTKATDHNAAGRMVNRSSPEQYMRERPGEALGRWPANVVHDGSEDMLAGFPESAASNHTRHNWPSHPVNVYSGFRSARVTAGHNDSGSAARFFYTAKASREDREAGLREAGLRFGSIQGGPEYHRPPVRNQHPTVKPIDLMRWLVRLVTPLGGLVLDPFMGSGSTGKACALEGFRFLGIEREPEYVALARARIEHAQAVADRGPEAVAAEAAGQQRLPLESP